MSTTSPMQASRLQQTLKYIFLGIFAVPWVAVPLWMLLVNSFKTEGESSVLSLALPTEWAAVENYTKVFTEGNYFVGLGNSLLIAIPVVVVVLILGSMAAWAYARSNAMGLRVTFFISAMSIMLPPAIIPTIFILTKIGLQGTTWGYMLVLTATKVGVIIFLAVGFVRTLPTDYEEAAQLDGAGRLRTYWHVILPLMRPVLFTGAVMLVIGVWNDFLFALFLLAGKANATLPLTLYSFALAPTGAVRWNLVFASVVMTSIPLFIAYVVLQRRVLSGLTEGGTTG
ncbi:carbohydrate ABC transporter permease [Herbiconiux sp. CPCC 205716]|uniref:Carbohydrate ABC transporter permease n=1 Tax=Herbiconiux gentiana TaxID=2970912 RepID=A0ABT2GAC7_9MICO|nr:carbohydrate ABC transporter permease [Herbiconiux gentiana]MCS5713159.1 carbohydrate ABC transporter permease [Herbiconiux gentiana]